MLQVPFLQMSPHRSPKNTTRQPSPTFQIENRILTLEQLQGIIHTCVKHKLESLQQIGQSTEFLLSHTSTKPKFKRFGEWVPRVDIWDDPESPNISATFELPGVRREDLAVHVQDHRYLVVQGQRPCRLGNDSGPSTGTMIPTSQPEDENNDRQLLQRGKFAKAELRYGRFSRKLDLGRGAFQYQNGHLSADLREGMLTVTWPRIPPGSENADVNKGGGGSSMITPVAILRPSGLGAGDTTAF
ncbi:hypothetical protein VKT23_006070 [Stygiomarasmius scandens]|uniref:SHSP domain-containing protein n=1 Tax=Marasmiellus scandens TaxID=2682957 RepID=A0ABR1JTV5_9AGAR